MPKLPRSFYQLPAQQLAPQFLGKYLAFNSPKGRLSGKVVEVEAYPAFSDEVSHGNKRTARTEVMYREGGYAYIYLVYGMYHQFAAVVNKKEVPEVVFIRAVIPDQGVEIMQHNFGRPVKSPLELTNSPGKLCKAFGMDRTLYGTDLTGDTLFFEDRGVTVSPAAVQTLPRVGISPRLAGHALPLRFVLTG